MPKPLNSHHASLLEKQKDLLSGLRSREEIHINGRAPDLLDEALASSARTIAVEKVNRDMETLRKVQKALQKLEDFGEDGYGVCEDCEEIIPEVRLDVLPWAERCLVCQEGHDQNSPREIISRGTMIYQIGRGHQK